MDWLTSLGVGVLIMLARMADVTLGMIQQNPWLGLFVALGFSLGSVLGILMERRIPLGNLTLRAVGGDEVRELAQDAVAKVNWRVPAPQSNAVKIAVSRAPSA
jgi:hypothetical protein